jgi:probable F420-dependent oxidoreductase
MGERRFRFGVTSGMFSDLATWTESARRAEALGYSTILAPDTLSTPSPIPMLAAAAAVTTTLRVGTWVLCDPLRNPRTTAWEVASVDHLSGGRFELGIGAGRPGADNDARLLRMEYGTPGGRVARLAESVRTIKQVLSGQEDGLPGAAQLPHPPILIAASGPKLLALAAREADIVAFGLAPDSTSDAALQRIDVVREAAGDRFDDLELASGLIAVGEGEYPWLHRMGTDLQTLADRGAITVLIGTPREMADALKRRRDRLGLSYLTVPAAAAERFAPVVEELAGN